MARFDLADFEGAVIQRLLPQSLLPANMHGVRRVDGRRAMAPAQPA